MRGEHFSHSGWEQSGVKKQVMWKIPRNKVGKKMGPYGDSLQSRRWGVDAMAWTRELWINVTLGRALYCSVCIFASHSHCAPNNPEVGSMAVSTDIWGHWGSKGCVAPFQGHWDLDPDFLRSPPGCFIYTRGVLKIFEQGGDSMCWVGGSAAHGTGWEDGYVARRVV